MSIALQETFDRFMLSLQKQEGINTEEVQQHEQVFQLLSEYIIYYSDLFQAENYEDNNPAAAWETSLDQFVDQLLQGNEQQDNLPSLDGLPFSSITGEYLRDFIAWHVLREPTVNSVMVQSYTETLMQWLKFALQHQWLEQSAYDSYIATLQDTLPDAKRAAIAAHLLLYHIRLGGGVSPRLRGTRFSSFKEGHARIAQIKAQQIYVSFDSEPEKKFGPITLPESIIQQLREGDVLDIELGLRDGVWNIVDIGPVYPAIVYVAAEEMALPDKQV
jgi:hypothetical protein